MRIQPLKILIQATVTVNCALLFLAFSGASSLADVRAEFRRAYPKAMAGDSTVIRKASTELRNYALWPDLQAAWYRSQLGKISDQSISDFVAAHAEKSAIRELRFRWLKSLARRRQWSTFLNVVDAYYADTTDPVLRCLQMRARINVNSGKTTNKAALELWMSGSSLPDECDPVFSYLADKKLLTNKRKRQRIDLALEQGNIKLARYLAKSAHRNDVERVSRWAKMRANPVAALQVQRKLRDNKANRELLFYGLKRAASRDPQTTHRLWQDLQQRYRFSETQRHSIAQGIALSAARDRLEISHRWLSDLKVHSNDSAVWRVRRALALMDWPATLEAVVNLPPELADDTTWIYWQARATEATGQSEDARELYRSIAGERSYYGFLAADRLDQPYGFEAVTVAPYEQIIATLEANVQLLRARELYEVNLLGFARAEWDRAVKVLDEQHKTQASILANRWQWHSRAISTLAKTGTSDYALSHPTPYIEIFDRATETSGIDRTWAYGVARTESLFMPDVRSAANAYGLMQIIPSTGRLVARSAHVNYRGRATLLHPESNITLGTHYLGQIYSRFGHNQVLATAAYNAGPHRVNGWLPTATRPADVWIENIPFTETRRYVKRVLAAQAITHWRLTGKEQRLAGMMPPILPNPGTANRFASN